ncbi:MAG: ABC transporter permease subunit [Erysipelotrichaceae bacterium]
MNSTNIKINKNHQSLKYLLFIVIATIIFLGSIYLLDLDLTKFIMRLSNIPTVINRMLVFDVSLIPNILRETLVSITLAFSALTLGTVISFVLAIFSASNLAPNKYLAVVIKNLVALIRAVPAIVWVLMVVASIGFGNTGGMIGLIFPTVGYLSKSFAASLEEDGFDHIEAIKSTGAPWLSVALFGIVSESLPKIIAWIAMRFENNIAEGISLGMVGVGGVGYLLNKAIMQFNYPAISTIIVVIFITMLSMELLTQTFKNKLRNANGGFK